MTARPIDILVIEDSFADSNLVIEALEEHCFASQVHVVRDGEEAMNFLLAEGPWQDRPMPELIFLDLNLPRKDGREVLREIKSHPLLCVIPIVVMTTSAAASDVQFCYELQASSYVVKPLDFESFFKAMKTLGDYWLQVVKLPDRLELGEMTWAP